MPSVNDEPLADEPAEIVRIGVAELPPARSRIRSRVRRRNARMSLGPMIAMQMACVAPRYPVPVTETLGAGAAEDGPLHIGFSLP